MREMLQTIFRKKNAPEKQEGVKKITERIVIKKMRECSKYVELHDGGLELAMINCFNELYSDSDNDYRLFYVPEFVEGVALFLQELERKSHFFAFLGPDAVSASVAKKELFKDYLKLMYKDYNPDLSALENIVRHEKMTETSEKNPRRK